MSVTLATIRTQVRSNLDEITEADWSDVELNRLINQRYHKLVSHITTTYEDYYVSTSFFNTTANQEEYTSADGLPIDIFKLRRVEITYDPTNPNATPVRALPLISIDAVPRDLGFKNGGPGVSIYTNSSYYVTGFGSSFKLGIIPIPNVTATSAGKIWYVPTQSNMVEDTDQPNIPYPDRYWNLIAEGATGDGLRFGAQESTDADKWDMKYEQGILLMQEELDDKKADDYKSILDVSGDTLDFTSF